MPEFPSPSGAPVVVDADGWVAESHPAPFVAAPADPATPEAAPAPVAEAPEAPPPAEPEPSPAPVAAATAPAETPEEASAPKRGRPTATDRIAQIHREIATSTRELRELERTRETTRAELHSQRAALDALTRDLAAARAAASAPPPAAPTEPAPTWAAFEAAGKSYDEFIDALTSYKIATAVSAERARLTADWDATLTARLTTRDAAAQVAIDNAAAARAEQMRDAQYQTRLAAFRSTHADFDSRLDPTLPLSRPMVDVVKDSAVGPLLLLHFSEHPEDAARIAAAHPITALRELGQLEARLEAAHSASAPAPTVSKAKPPIQAVVGSSISARATAAPDVSTLSEMDFGPDWIRLETAREQETLKARGA